MVCIPMRALLASGRVTFPMLSLRIDLSNLRCRGELVPKRTDGTIDPHQGVGLESYCERRERRELLRL
jgi:hypothetical protein